MASSFFAEYETYLNDLRNQIMQLQFKFIKCKDALEIDYAKGVITEEEYRVYKDLKIADYFKGANEKYTLSLDEVDFLNKYADFDIHGDLYLTMVKKEYLDRLELLNKIFESVRKFNFFDMLSLGEKKKIFIDIVEKEYGHNLEEFSARAIKIRSLYGEYYANRTEYKDLVAEVKACSANRILVADIEKATPTELNDLICKFYGIDYSYYRWYKDMELKEEFDNGFVFGEQVETLRQVEDAATELSELELDYRELSKVLESYVKQLDTFLITFSNFKYVPDVPSEKKRGLFRKKSSIVLNNKEELFKIFSLLIGIGSTYSYTNTLRENEKDSLEVMFERYFNNVYGKAIDYVEIDSFKHRFMNEVISFYRAKIEETTAMLRKKMADTKDASVSINTGVRAAKYQATVSKNIYDRFDSISKLGGLEDFSAMDAQKIYASLKEYLTGGYDAETKTLFEETADKKVL